MPPTQNQVERKVTSSTTDCGHVYEVSLTQPVTHGADDQVNLCAMTFVFLLPLLLRIHRVKYNALHTAVNAMNIYKSPSNYCSAVCSTRVERSEYLIRMEESGREREMKEHFQEHTKRKNRRKRFFSERSCCSVYRSGNLSLFTHLRSQLHDYTAGECRRGEKVNNAHNSCSEKTTIFYL